MRSSTWAPALRGVLAVLSVLGVGGCIVLGYDFDKEPPASCATAADCPGADVCGTRVCEQGVCKVLNPIPAGMDPPGQNIGDCKQVTCDGKGNEIAVADATDVPDDGNDCTDDLCIQGTPTNPPSDATKPCGEAAYTKCNGIGACAGCMAPADCGADTPCATWACDMSQTCVRTLQPVGTLAKNPALGDCRANICNSIGESPEEFYAGDPIDDGNECTTDACAPGGDTTHESAADGTKCAGTCKACTGGACVDCAGNFTCSGADCKPLQQLEEGFGCSLSADCLSGHCVDGVCCENDCSGPCMACRKELTGADNGTCSAVFDSTDPDDSCQSPPADLCVGGKCQCYNGIKDPVESGVDCGGNCKGCPGKWVCDGINGCEGVLSPTCCDFDCFTCGNEFTDCNATHGSPCTVGDPPKPFSLGVVAQASCFLSGNACKRLTCNCK